MKNLLIVLTLLVILPKAYGQITLGEDLEPYLAKSGYAGFDLVAVEFLPSVYYDSAFRGELFGFQPKEVLISELNTIGHHIQVNYEYSKTNPAGNGYGPTLEIIKELESAFGMAKSVVWTADEIDIKWNMQNIVVSLKHLELQEEGIIIVRLDLKSRNHLVSLR